MPSTSTQCSASDVLLCILSGWCPPSRKPRCVLPAPALAMHPACAHTCHTLAIPSLSQTIWGRCPLLLLPLA